MEFELSQDFLDRFVAYIEAKNVSAIEQIADDLYPADLAVILAELEYEQAEWVLNCFEKSLSAKIISISETEVRSKILERMKPETIAPLVSEMYSDDAADVLNELKVAFREKIIALLDTEMAAHVVDLLKYDSDCAGGLMAKELVKANINWTTQECIEAFREQAKDIAKIYAVYVVDDHDTLWGRISLSNVILAKPETKIAEIYTDEVIYAHVHDHAEDVANQMQKYDLVSIPVVNAQMKLLGRITIDDVVDVITEQADTDLKAIAGISENVEEDDTIWKLSWARLPWLLVGMMGGLMGAQFLGQFETELLLVPAMAFFIPLITATGGNVGIQSSTIVVQSLAEGGGIQQSVWLRLVKVFGVALINGIVIATVVFGFNLFFIKKTDLALVVSTALFAVVILASIMGTITPLVLNRLGINPALASGPFITTANDLLGLAVYFMVAKLLYGV